MSFLGVVSWAFGLAALFGFSALVVVGRRDATTRRVATWTLWIAIVVQLAFVPFYARSLVGRVVTVHVGHVSCTARSHGCSVTGSYTDAAGVRHAVSGSYPAGERERYFDWGATEAPFLVVDGVPWFAQLGDRTAAPLELLLLAGLAWLGCLWALRHPRRARLSFDLLPRAMDEQVKTAVLARRADLRALSGPPLGLGASHRPDLAWFAPGWIGVLFTWTWRAERFPWYSQVIVELPAFYPAVGIAAFSGMMPWPFSALASGEGVRQSTDDPAFDRSFEPVGASQPFVRSVLDAEGRALVRRLRAAGVRTLIGGGRRTWFFIDTNTDDPDQVVELFASVEAWLTHVTTRGQATRAPETLCELCGVELLPAATIACTACGRRVHTGCREPYGGCPLPPCARPEQIIAGICRVGAPRSAPVSLVSERVGNRASG